METPSGDGDGDGDGDGSGDTLTYSAVQEAYIKAVNADQDDWFGYDVAIESDTIVVGAYFEDSISNLIINGTTASDDDSSASSGAAYVYFNTDNTWEQQSYLKACNADDGHGSRFGAAVAVSGNTIAVGAVTESSNSSVITHEPGCVANSAGDRTGAVFIYKRTGANWAREAQIKPSQTASDEYYFGFALDLDADTLVVGAKGDDNNGTNSGAVYVYTRSGEIWTEEAFVEAVNVDAGDEFGYSVAVDGDTLVVGAPYEDSGNSGISNSSSITSDNNDLSDSGAVYVYARSGSTWTQQAYIKSPESDSSDFFGERVVIDGDTIAVNATHESSCQNTISSGAGGSTDNECSSTGAVYVYKWDGAEWSQQAYIKPQFTASGDEINFGYDMELSGDILVVGAPGFDDSTTNDVGVGGRVYVYKRTGIVWEEVKNFQASNSNDNYKFGKHLAYDSNKIVVGDTQESSNQKSITNGSTSSTDQSSYSSGAVYVHTLTTSE